MMIKTMLLFSFLYSVCHTMGLYYAQKSDFGYSLLFCTEMMCDFKFYIGVIFLFFLVIFLMKIAFTPKRLKGIKWVVLCIVFAIFISISYTFFVSLFYSAELQGDILSYEIGFPIIETLYRTLILFFLLWISRSIFRAIFRNVNFVK